MAQQLVRDETTCIEVLAYGVPFNYDDRSGKNNVYRIMVYHLTVTRR